MFVLSIVAAGLLSGCGDDEDDTTSPAVSSGISGATGATGAGGPSALNELRATLGLPPTSELPSPLEVDEACQTAQTAADAYDKLRLSSLIGGALEAGSRGRIDAEGVEIASLLGVMAIQSCDPFEQDIGSYLDQDLP